MMAMRLFISALLLRQGLSIDSVEMGSVSLMQANFEVTAQGVEPGGEPGSETEVAKVDKSRKEKPETEDTTEKVEEKSANVDEKVEAKIEEAKEQVEESVAKVKAKTEEAKEQVEESVANFTLAEPSTSITSAVYMQWIGVSVLLLAAAHMTPKVETLEGSPSNSSKLVAEFIGTFALVFCVGCNVLLNTGTWAVTSIACTLMVMIYALGGISGGNFNPAVSWTLGMSGKMKWNDVVAYTCTQSAAGIIAGLCYGAMLGKTWKVGPSATFTTTQAGLAALLYTFMLTFVVLNTACSKKHAGKEQFYGLAIGFCVVAGGYGAGAISGGCFNPAIALGIGASGGGIGNAFIYWGYQFLGAVMAAGCFRICRPDDYDNSVTEYPLSSKLLSEFLGTYILILTIGLNVLAESPAAVFSIAASLMCMIFALGSCSGGHFNPAVTYAILRRGVGPGLMGSLMYVFAQFLGGLLAAQTYIYLRSGATVKFPDPVESSAYIGEFIFTFILAFVVLCVATVDSPLSNYFGLAIGSCVTAGGVAIGSLSGGQLNPAVSLSIGLTSGNIVEVAKYAAVQFAAGEFASELFKVTHAAELARKK